MGGFGETPRQVIGVVGDTKEFGWGAAVPPTVFVSHAQVSDDLMVLMHRAFPLAWVVRSSVALGLANAIREQIHAVDGQQPVANLRLMTAVIDESVGPQRFNTLLMTCFAVVALVLTAIGIYGVLSYQVSRRTREIGIRMALGARRMQVLRLIVGQGMSMTLLGGGAGLLVAAWGRSILSAQIPAMGITAGTIDLSMDGRVLIFTLGVALLTGVLFGLAPALQLSNPDVYHTLKEGGAAPLVPWLASCAGVW